ALDARAGERLPPRDAGERGSAHAASGRSGDRARDERRPQAARRGRRTRRARAGAAHFGAARRDYQLAPSVSSVAWREVPDPIVRTRTSPRAVSGLIGMPTRTPADADSVPLVGWGDGPLAATIHPPPAPMYGRTSTGENCHCSCASGMSAVRATPSIVGRKSARLPSPTSETSGTSRRSAPIADVPLVPKS